eukprot:augustus_masked-scaffold_13-processed-gene-2.12-mRNA-1 protein AED:0.01 eAED:0.04 QI:0/-1/0/1/-1/1/1/0/370
MEQLFRLFNELLIDSPETRNRKLSLRTYNIVPLTHEVGLIEFARNTISFGDYLHGPLRKNAGESCAHSRHNKKNHWSFYKCVSLLQSVAKKAGEEMQSHARKYRKTGSGNKNKLKQKDALEALVEKHEHEKLEAYNKVCTHYPPVFNNFFVENSVDMDCWYDLRKSFARSTATASMVGYVVGIGDRHTQNILVDKSNAEVVHIDFGFVFDRSKLLRVPEMVPFRLTPDIVDGFGFTGTAGTFQLCSEKVLDLMRKNFEIILTICDVFLHDPFYQWLVTPKDLLEKSDRNEDIFSYTDEIELIEDEGDVVEQASTNAVAQRALTVVKEKLLGNHNPSGQKFDVPTQVRSLIREATDKKTLSKMYAGWGAFV